MVNQIDSPSSIVYNVPKPKTSQEQQLYKACTDFEAMLAKQMLETMQRSSDFFGKGFGGDYFKSMFQDELSKQIANSGGLGLAKFLYEQISKTNNVK